MNPKPLLTKIQEIEKDCLQMKKEQQLTEYGEGELHIIKLIKKELSKKDKYSVDDIKKIPIDSRTGVTNLMIANELHNLSKILSKNQKI